MAEPVVAGAAADLAALRAELADLREAFDTIGQGGVDAVVIGEPGSEQLYTLAGADRPYRLIIEEMDEGAVTVSETGVVLYVNSCLTRLLGREHSELVGASCDQLVVEGDRTTLEWLLATAPGHHARGEVHLAAPTVPVPATVAVSCLDLDGVHVRCLIVTDLTPQKEVEQTLEAHVRDRTVELERANARLTDANAELEEFASSVSHDLRAPLRAIHGFAQILVEEYADVLSEEGLRLLGVVTANTERMRRLIDDILDLSRVGRTELRADHIDMDGLVRSVATELRGQLVDREVTIDVAPLTPAHGDLGLLRQVWVNLLGNAVKFSERVPDARIQVTSEERAAETVYRVSDNGAGFDQAYAHKVFGAFDRLHGVEFAGTGIGLAIVKRIVTRHGGWVAAEGEIGEGATFSFALPAEPWT
jgi:PAS domain S-box-containing protein